jgi:peroxiredoxin
MTLPRANLTARWMYVVVAVLVLAPAAGAARGQGDPDLKARLADATSRAEKDRGTDRLRGDLGEILDLAQGLPNDRAALRALEFVVMADYQGALGQQERAIRLLARDHLTRPRMGNYCQVLTNQFYSPAAESFIRAVLSRHPSREGRALACHALATLLRQQVRFARFLRAHPDQVKSYEADHGADVIAKFLREKDPDATEKDAESVLERVVNEFGDMPRSPGDPRTLGEIAAGELNEMRHLNVGQTAPEIDWVDVGGERFKLSDYRGNVVLLVFSGEWCRPCVEMYPRERALLARYAGKPFAVVSVNTDATREPLRRSVEAGRVTWRCWYDGGTHSPITTRWGVSGHPMVYVLDRAGVIRHKDVLGEALEKAVGELMAKE